MYSIKILLYLIYSRFRLDFLYKLLVDSYVRIRRVPTSCYIVYNTNLFCDYG